MSFWMFPRPHGEKIIILDFSGSGMQIEVEQNIVSTTAIVESKDLDEIKV